MGEGGERGGERDATERKQLLLERGGACSLPEVGMCLASFNSILSDPPNAYLRLGFRFEICILGFRV